MLKFLVKKFFLTNALKKAFLTLAITLGLYDKGSNILKPQNQFVPESSLIDFSTLAFGKLWLNRQIVDPVIMKYFSCPRHNLGHKLFNRQVHFRRFYLVEFVKFNINKFYMNSSNDFIARKRPYMKIVNIDICLNIQSVRFQRKP